MNGSFEDQRRIGEVFITITIQTINDENNAAASIEIPRNVSGCQKDEQTGNKTDTAKSQ
ncbi:hypothetical protein PSH58_21300 [Pseudomonas hefeiensis]|uniref:Uncharacterized protein n=1 Tax=Pseudomonas hefeiensis TaxID=2738125 RepID=A0ABY9G780_9PSED|nr:MULTISPECIES: hypothetical protein [unclassified Pseudomonas]WLH11372.1 hypothetical protein PSH57_21260 [Pseudomonas sp. FP205]WLH94441.1 hypothetical protein PSH58_21300 [Pseudomonas sp. FP53]WLI38720.1 hypothetical protein PSH74_21240 [Pseudomonas sp. FP821]